MGTIGVFNIFDKSPNTKLHKTVGKSMLQSQKNMQWNVDFVFKKRLYNGCIMLRFNQVVFWRAEIKGYPNLNSYFEYKFLLLVWEYITIKEYNLFLPFSQVQGLRWANLTITTNVYNVFHKSPRTKGPRTNEKSSYKVRWPCKALQLFCCFWKTGHLMDLFPVLGTVTHMGRFPQDGNFVPLFKNLW